MSEHKHKWQFSHTYHDGVKVMGEFSGDKRAVFYCECGKERNVKVK